MSSGESIQLALPGFFASTSSGENSQNPRVGSSEVVEEETSDEDESKNLHRQLILLSISVLLTMSSYSGLMDLQSSVNISGALGNNALMLTFITTILVGLLFTPLVVIKLGAKVTLIISQACYLVYVLANFYPTWFTLLSAGVCFGIGEALLHVPALMYVTYYGRNIAQYRGKSKRKFINRYVGYYNGIVQMCEIFSNLISFVVLEVGRQLEKSMNTASSNDETPSFQNTTELLDLSHLLDSLTSSSRIVQNLADFTSHPNIQNVNQSSVENESTFSSKSPFVSKYDYEQILTELPLSTVANDNNQSSIRTSKFSLNSSIFHEMSLKPEDVHDFSQCAANECYVESEFDSNNDKYVPISSTAFYIMVGLYSLLALAALPIMASIPPLPRTEIEEMIPEYETEEKPWSIQSEIPSTKSQKSMFRVIASHFDRTIRQMINPEQILLAPITLYIGLHTAFISSEINRAFVSCTVGVEKVGIAMFARGFMIVFVSILFGALAGRNFLWNCFVAMAVTLDLVLYIFCLHWKPTHDTLWMPYVICIIFGITDGVWEPYIDGKYAKYFPANEEAAYSVMIIWICVGHVIMYALTTVLCIREKLIIQIVVLLTAVVCCVGAEIVHQKKRRLHYDLMPE